MSSTEEVRFEIPYLKQLEEWPSFKILNDNVDGIIPSCKFSSWQSFDNYIQQDRETHSVGEMIYRGQRRFDWPLAPTLTRIFQEAAVPDDLAQRLRSKFKLAMRGRGVDLSKLEDIEVWAYGQHFGLATPLLDWTESPFVALFFAFSDDDRKEEKENPSRAIFRLNRTAIEEVLEQIFYEPTLGDNGRLVNQAGLFTLTLSGDETLASTIVNNLVDAGAVNADNPNELARYICKLHISNIGRVECLNTLRKMNIHHASLFPDPGGASAYCNDWLARAILERSRQEATRRRAAEDAERLRSEPRHAQRLEGHDGGVVASILKNALGELSPQNDEELSDWVQKIDARYSEEAGTDWPKRPSIEAKLRIEFRKLLGVLGTPPSTRDAAVTQLLDLYKNRYEAEQSLKAAADGEDVS